MPQNARWTLPVFALAVLLAALYVYRSELLALLASVSQWVDSMGEWAPLLYVALFAVAVPLFIPTTPLILAAGMLFDFWPGILLAYLGNTLGGWASFALGRTALQQQVRRLANKHRGFEALDKAVHKEGVKTAILIRMSPLLPGPLLNYALGITRLRLRDYLLASIGTLPVLIAFTFVGSTLGQFAQLGEADTMSDLSSRSMPLMLAGVVATVAASVLLARRAAKILEKQGQSEPTTSRPSV